jgi:hypothetical protein
MLLLAAFGVVHAAPKGGVRKRIQHAGDAAVSAQEAHRKWLVSRHLKGKLPAKQLHEGMTTFASGLSEPQRPVLALVGESNQNSARAVSRALAREATLKGVPLLYEAEAPMWDPTTLTTFQGKLSFFACPRGHRLADCHRAILEGRRV